MDLSSMHVFGVTLRFARHTHVPLECLRGLFNVIRVILSGSPDSPKRTSENRQERKKEGSPGKH